MVRRIVAGGVAALVAAMLVACGGGRAGTDSPPPVPATPGLAVATTAPTASDPDPTSTVAPAPTATRPQPTMTPTAAATPMTRPTPATIPVPAPLPTAHPPPEPTPTQTPEAEPAVHFAPLALGEPRALPAGTALYYMEHRCESAWNTYRVVAPPGAAALVVDRPAAGIPELPGLGSVWIGASASGRTLASLECDQGYCLTIDGPSEDAVASLWVSTDGGETWERWGEVPPAAGISEVAEGDVALYIPGNQGPRLRWFRSGEEVAPPQGLSRPFLVMWRGGVDGRVPLWAGRPYPTFVTSGHRLATPPGGDGANGGSTWWPAVDLPDGSLLWTQSDVRFATTSEGGEVLGAYSWAPPKDDPALSKDDPKRTLQFVDHLGGELFVGLLGGGGEYAERGASRSSWTWGRAPCTPCPASMLRLPESTARVFWASSGSDSPGRIPADMECLGVKRTYSRPVQTGLGPLDLREQGRRGGEAVRMELREAAVDGGGRAHDVGGEGAVPGGVEGGDAELVRAALELLERAP